MATCLSSRAMTGELVATLTCGTDSDAAEEAKKVPRSSVSTCELNSCVPSFDVVPCDHSWQRET